MKKENREKANEAIEKMEELFVDHIISLHKVISAANDRGDPNVAIFINKRHAMVYYRDLLWQIRDAIK